MKIAVKNKIKKDKVKKKGSINKPKPKKEQVFVVAQEIKYARWLSGNDKKTRDRVLKALKKWILNCFEKGYEFKEEDFTRVWKGLFYAVWMSDKPLVQEELCENISAVLDLFPPEHLRHALLMTKAGLKMLATEWYGIDQHRMDKFLMLVRRYLRGSLRVLSRCEWSVASCRKYANMLSGPDGLLAVQTPHYARNATSMLLHFTDCFLEELAKVSRGAVCEAGVCALLAPFARYTCGGTVTVLCAGARRLLTALLRQSPQGLRYRDKSRAWKQMGCPEGGPDALQEVSDDDDDAPMENGDAASDDDSDDGRPLDPRAGRVDVELPLLPVPARALAGLLRAALPAARGAAHRRRLHVCLDRFERLAAGEYPLRVEAPPAPPAPPRAPRAARALAQLEARLRADADELKLRGLSRRHRKRLLSRARAGHSIVELAATAHAARATNGEWLVESTETEPKKAKKDTSNKENQEKGKKNKNKVKKRKNSVEIVNGDVPNKKQKLDQNKSKMINNEHKKDDLVNNKSKKEKQNKTQLKSPEEKGNKDEVKKEVKAVKNELKEIKIKKMKNQPQIISHKNNKTNSTEKNINKELEKPKTDITKLNKTEKPDTTTKNFEKVSKTDTKSNKKEKPAFLVNKVKNFQKPLPNNKDKKEKDLAIKKPVYETPKKVKFVLKNNSMQKPVDYYKSVRQSPNIPFDSAKRPTKTNLKPSTPSPINPFFKKKLRMRN